MNFKYAFKNFPSFQRSLKLFRFFGFTMTEVMIVMTILGVIATIMITTIKPAEYKEKAMETAAKKVMNSIDHATTMILLNDSTDGTMYNLIATDGTKFRIGQGTNGNNSNMLADLYKKYLVTTRKVCNNAACSCYLQGAASTNLFYLKDGACMSVLSSTGDGVTIFPGETTTTTSRRDAKIVFDVNGEKEPNVAGKDIFVLPVGEKGIIWDAPPAE